MDSCFQCSHCLFKESVITLQLLGAILVTIHGWLSFHTSLSLAYTSRVRAHFMFDTKSPSNLFTLLESWFYLFAFTLKYLTYRA